MYCSKCGTELSSDAKFCEKCGAALTTNEASVGTQPIENSSNHTPTAIRKNSIGDNVGDKLLSKISKQNIKTIRISMEDMVELLKEHFIIPASTDKEYQKIQKTVNGGLIGIKTLTSKDENYYISVSVAFQLCGRLNLLHLSDSNWIILKNVNTGECFQYSALFWGKFKKAVKQAIAAEKQS